MGGVRASGGDPAVERELTAVLQKAEAVGYGRGYGDAATARAIRAPSNPDRATDRGPGDAAQSLLDDATVNGYLRGYDDRVRGASRVDAAVRRHQVSYVKEVTAVDDRAQAEFRYTPRRARRHRLSEMRRYVAAGGRRRCSTGRRWKTAGGMSGRAADELETLTVTGETPTVRAIWIPGWRWSRNAVMRATMRTGVARGCRWGCALRSARPSRPLA